MTDEARIVAETEARIVAWRYFERSLKVSAR